jgi:hypothetical protein
MDVVAEVVKQCIILIEDFLSGRKVGCGRSGEEWPDWVMTEQNKCVMIGCMRPQVLALADHG